MADKTNSTSNNDFDRSHDDDTEDDGSGEVDESPEAPAGGMTANGVSSDENANDAHHSMVQPAMVQPAILPPGVEFDVSGTICVPKTRVEMTETTRAAPNQEVIDGEDLGAGDEVGRYRIREMIGRGGCGTVYAAEHMESGNLVAVKVLRLSLAGSSHQVRRFVQEAEALRLIDHPGIVEVYASGTLFDGRPYFAMELLHGRSLAAILGERGRFSPAEALEIMQPICEMLELAHQAGIVHRDIKANNIMVLTHPDRAQIKLLDFGLAKLINSEQSASMQTSVGVVLGTLHSMAPEQILGKTIDGRADVYALGALLHRLLTGRHPFEDVDNQKVARMHLSAPPPLPSQLAPVSPALDAIVRRAMEKDRDRRYPSANAFLAALRDAVGGKSGGQQGRAVAIYVEGRIDADAELDDLLWQRLMAILDAAENKLRGARMQIVLQTSTAILAAKLVSDGSEPAVVEVQPVVLDEVAGIARDLAQDLENRYGRDDRLHINVCLHHDRAELHSWGKQVRIAGGRIMDVDRWAPRAAMQGVYATGHKLSADGRASGEMSDR